MKRKHDGVDEALHSVEKRLCADSGQMGEDTSEAGTE